MNPPTPTEPPPLTIIELLQRVGGEHLRVQNLAASVVDIRTRKSGEVEITFGTNQLNAGDVLHVASRPWAELPMTGLIIWMPTAMMQHAIRAHVAEHGSTPDQVM